MPKTKSLQWRWQTVSTQNLFFTNCAFSPFFLWQSASCVSFTMKMNEILILAVSWMSNIKISMICILFWEVVSFISGAYDAVALLCLSWWNRVRQVISHVLLGICVFCSCFLELNAFSDLNPQNKESSGIDISEYRLDWGRDLDSLELVYSGTETYFQISNLEASTDYCCRLQVIHDVSNITHFKYPIVIN